MTTTKPLAISVGCPCGIGPEVAIAALRDFPERVVLVGDRAQLVAIAREQAVDLGPHAIVQPTAALAARDRKPGKPTQKSGSAQLAWVDEALDLVVRGEARALVTGPVSKSVVASSGAPGSAKFRGHTEHLQAKLRSPEVVMAFWSPVLSSALVTTHLPLARVPRAITPERVASATFHLAALLARLQQAPPIVAVASLNPHAGESGLLGGEEAMAIAPGIARAKERLKRAKVRATIAGPIGAESAFRRAKNGDFAGVVAMYHDQATIPMKLLGFGDAVNVSLGLPIVRTSVDHGTAYDAAGKGTADARGMRAALELADRLTRLGPNLTSMSEARRGRSRISPRKMGTTRFLPAWPTRCKTGSRRFA